MPYHLQASVARIGATLFFSLMATSGMFAQSDMTSEADEAFDRRGYFEAAREYVALYLSLIHI